MTTLYRAVDPDEFLNIMSTGKFSFAPAEKGGATMKQFALSFDETMKYADAFPGYAAIISIQVPKAAVSSFNFSKSIDPFIFKSGVVTVQDAGALSILNNSFKELKHAF